MKKIIALFFILIMMVTLCIPVYAETEGERNIREGYASVDSRDYFDAGCSFIAAAGFYYNIKEYSEAAKWYEEAANAFEMGAPDYDDWKLGALEKRDLCLKYVGTHFSEGNLTIIVGIAAAVIFGLIGFIIGRKTRLN